MSATALAEEAVKGVSLYEPPKSATIDTGSARISPNQWQPPACLTCEDVASVQTRLIELGYAPGKVDGIIGPRTMAAIKAYQGDNALAVDGQVTDDLLVQLQVKSD